MTVATVALIDFLMSHTPLSFPEPLDSRTRLAAICSSGFAHAALTASLVRACKGIERQALADAVTIGEVAGWLDTRWRGAPPPDLAKATSDLTSADRVMLRPVLPRDIELMYAAATDPQRGMRWRYRGETPGYDEFNARLWSGQRCHFIAERDAQPIAYLAAYDLSLKSRHCYLAVLSLRAEATRGHVFDGAFNFIDHLFRAFELRKLYIEVAGYNLNAVLGGPQTLFEMEGVLRDHEEWNGELWDNYIGALSRSRWEEYASPWRTWFGAEGGPLRSRAPSGGFARV
jgi:RimJ/RimL family protein N-acetyltransferase